MTLRGLRSRLLKLERETKKTDAPTFDEYSAAASREGARRIRGALERLARLPSLHGSTTSHTRLEGQDSLLVDDTPEQAQADRRTVEAWERAHGKADIRPHAEQARARILDMRRR